MQIVPLVDIAEKFVVNESNAVTSENFADLWEVARKLDRTLLSKAVGRFLERNFSTIRSSQKFLSLPSNYLKQILESSFLKVRKESEVLETVVKWVTQDEERETELPKMMECVRLDQLEKEELWQIAMEEGMLKETKECRMPILEALKRRLVGRSEEKASFEQRKMAAERPRHSTSGLLMVAGGFESGRYNIPIFLMLSKLVTRGALKVPGSSTLEKATAF